MNAAAIMNERLALLASTVRTPGKAKWRRIEGRVRRKDGVRRHTAGIREVKYGS